MRILNVVKKNMHSLIFVVAAFGMMVAVSFFSLYGMLQSNIYEKAELVVNFTESQIQTDLLELEVAVRNASATASNTLNNGGTVEDVLENFVAIHRWAEENQNIGSDISLVYGYIHGEFINGALWDPEDPVTGFKDSEGNLIPYIPQERLWYTIAENAEAGEVVFSPPYADSHTGQLIISASVKLKVNDVEVGIVAVDLYMKRFNSTIHGGNLFERSYVMLIDRESNIIAHTVDDYVGINLAAYRREYADALEVLFSENETSDIRVPNNDGSPASAYGRQIMEDFYLVVLTPLTDYNNDLYFTASILGAFGTLFALLLIALLLKIAYDKAMSDSESNSKSVFLARMSHEIRTPMNAIIGMSELIVREKPPPGIYDNAVTIRNAGNNLLFIINDVFNLSKIETGKIEVESEEYVLASVVNDVVGIIRMRMTGNRVRMMVDIEPSLPAVLIGDRTKVRQIMLNLLANAVKYTKEGAIRLELSRDKFTDNSFVLVISIKDTGAGISEHDLKRLTAVNKPLGTFKRWAAESTGLGLAISKSFCKAMNGQFTIESEVGKGSVFTVSLPQRYREFVPFAKVENLEEKYVLFYGERRLTAESVERSLNNLGVKYVRVDNLSDVRDKLSEFTHIFLPAFRYGNITAELKEHCRRSTKPKPEIVLFADVSENVAFRGVQTLTMPSHILSVANILNGVRETHEEIGKDNEFMPLYAPDAKVLVVDDITANLLVVEGLLSLYSIKADTVKRGAGAIEMVQQNEYDVVFMDHMMPEMDGIEATKLIRGLKDESFKTLPIVALTANAVSGMRELFLESGMNDFLAKPVEPEKLEDMLFKWLPEEKIKKRENVNADSDSKTADDSEVVCEFAALLAQIDGVSVERALTYAGGSYPLLESNVRMITGLLPDSMQKLNDLIGKDISLFAIQIHGVKNMLANIGAYLLAESAKEIEELAKSGEKEACDELYSEFANNMSLLIKELQILVSEQADEKAAGDIAKVYEILPKLSAAVELFDSALALELINSVSGFTYGGEIDESLGVLARAFEQFDFDKAVEIITKLNKP